MKSKPDVFVIIPPPMYKDGWIRGMANIFNQRMSKEYPQMAKECGVGDDQIIDLYSAMGGDKLSMPQLYCDNRWCDGFHPVDAGQDVMALETLKVIMNYYLKKPKGRLEQK